MAIEQPRGVVVDDRALHRAQRLARLDPDAFHQRGARVLVGAQRVALATGAVQGKHELEAGVGQVFFRPGAHLDEAGRGRLAPQVVRQIGHRRASPERESPHQELGSQPVLPTLAGGAGIGAGPLEDPHVDCASFEREGIPAANRGDPATRQCSAETRDVGLCRLHRGRGRVVGPQSVEQRAHGEGLAGVEREGGQHRALLRGRDRNRPVVGRDRHRPQQPDLQARSVRGRALRGAAPARPQRPRRQRGRTHDDRYRVTT